MNGKELYHHTAAFNQIGEIKKKLCRLTISSWDRKREMCVYVCLHNEKVLNLICLMSWDNDVYGANQKDRRWRIDEWELLDYAGDSE